MTSTPLYAPLQRQNAIRLLRLRPGNDGNDIDMILEPFRLNSAIQFNALSYVWGSLTPQRWVSCNGYIVPITSSLHSALSQLLLQGFDGFLWVDAICINQQDKDEKSAQVAMMRDIFSRAAKVIFWLGEKQLFDQAGAELMRTFFENHPKPPVAGELQHKSLAELGLPYFDYGWVGWASLLARPWFGRVWIVQEFSNAKESVFMSGAVEIPTKVLLHCAAATWACTEINNIFIMQLEGISSAEKLLERPLLLHAQISVRVGKEDIDIDYLWRRSRLLEATDERDRIFALMSLQTTLPMGMIDYSKDLVEVYTEVAKAALTQPIYWKPPSQENHDVLDIVTYRSSRFLACKDCSSRGSNLPSWVPDWRPSGIRFVPLTYYFGGVSFFEHPYQDAIIENRILSISGLLVDRPWVIVDSMPYAEDLLLNFNREVWKSGEVTMTWAKAMLNWQYMCYVLARSKNAAFPRHQVLAAFCRTMAFGVFSDQNDATLAEYIGGFQALRTGISRMTNEDDRHGAVFEGPESSDRRRIEYKVHFDELQPGRKFCVTEAGRLAWVPQVAKPGDEICFLAGCAVPFVIRQAGESWELLGDCYLDGEMRDDSPIFLLQPQLFRFT